MPEEKTPRDSGIVIDMCDEMNDDWLRAARLKRRAEAGDAEAQAELDRMENEDLERKEP